MAVAYCLAGVLIFVGWVFSVCLHEFSHALVAYWGGDTSVKRKGYLTFNPLKYTHPTYSLMLPMIYLAIGGIGLPGGAVYIQTERLRNRAWVSAVSAAGVVGNLLFAFVLSLPFRFHWIPDLAQPEFVQWESRRVVFDPIAANWLWYSIAFLITLEISSVLFNLLPLPPLDGYGIVRPWLPAKWQYQLDQLSSYSFWIIFGLFWFVPPFTAAFWNTTTMITEWLGVPSIATTFGSMIFSHPFNRLTIFLALLATCALVKYSEKLQWYDKGNVGLVWRQQFSFASGQNPSRQQVARQSSPKSSPKPLQPTKSRSSAPAQPAPRSAQKGGFWEEVRLTALRRQLLNRVQQRADVAERLLQLERVKNPSRSERWYLEKVLYDLRRGR